MGVQKNVKYILNVYLGRWTKYDVKKHIEFNTAVRNITFEEATNEFTVQTEHVISISSDEFIRI